LRTFEVDAAAGGIEVGVAPDAIAAALGDKTFELRPRFVMSADTDVDPTHLLWGRRDFLFQWDLWLSEREGRGSLLWRD
jgi:hypothetical protein